jgi:hypothetical protein
MIPALILGALAIGYGIYKIITSIYNVDSLKEREERWKKYGILGTEEEVDNEIWYRQYHKTLDDRRSNEFADAIKKQKRNVGNYGRAIRNNE